MFKKMEHNARPRTINITYIGLYRILRASAPLALLTLTAGCSANMAAYANAIAKDQANVCVSIATPYGTGLIGRVNTPGAKVNISGGQCTIEGPAPK